MTGKPYGRRLSVLLGDSDLEQSQFLSFFSFPGSSLGTHIGRLRVYEDRPPTAERLRVDLQRCLALDWMSCILII